MSELLSNEAAFLSLPQVNTTLQLDKVKAIKSAIKSANKKKYTKTIEMTKVIASAIEWFNSDEAIELFAEEGIAWNRRTFGLKVFGYDSSFWNKLCKVSSFDERIEPAYNAKCDADGIVNRSVEALITFEKSIDLDNLDVADDASEEEVADAEAEAIESGSVDRVNYIFTMAFRNPSGNNLSVRISEDGKVSGSNLEEIETALRFLQNSISE
tara:strand:+ start:4492 stop:5127 length:636 start_codon:yes stop_codon:yes gene_type:complete